MENTKYNYFGRTFDIDGMLYDNAKWLAKQTGLTTNEFVDIAEQLELRQEDWATFWKMMRGIEERSERNVEIYIREYEDRITDKDFRILKSILGEPYQERSNCCVADVAPHNADDHTSICMDCREGCGIVYVF